MSRERDIYRKMRQDAQESINSQPPFKPKPVKPNYLSAVVWTSVVAAIVCTIFMGILLYLLNASNIESNLEDAANHAVYNLEQIVRQQNSQLQQLKEENKKIYDYLNLWTPIDCRTQKEKWVIPGYGLPEVVLPDRLDEPPRKYNYDLQLLPLCE